MCQSTPAPAWAIQLHQLHKHGAFDDIDVALNRIRLMADALKGIGTLMMPEHNRANEQLNMAFRADAAAVFEFFGDVLAESREIAASAAERLQHDIEQSTTQGV